MGARMVMRVQMAVRDAHEVFRAKQYLKASAEEWEDPRWVMNVMSDVPLFGAYFIWGCSDSDLIGFLTDASQFNPVTFQNDIYTLRNFGNEAGFLRGSKDTEDPFRVLRNLANKCQTTAKWGFQGMPGFMQFLDTRWHKQIQKEAANWAGEYRYANYGAMGRRAAGWFGKRQKVGEHYAGFSRTDAPPPTDSV